MELHDPHRRRPGQSGQLVPCRRPHDQLPPFFGEQPGGPPEARVEPAAFGRAGGEGEEPEPPPPGAEGELVASFPDGPEGVSPL